MAKPWQTRTLVGMLLVSLSLHGIVYIIACYTPLPAPPVAPLSRQQQFIKLSLQKTVAPRPAAQPELAQKTNKAAEQVPSSHKQRAPTPVKPRPKEHASRRVAPTLGQRSAGKVASSVPQQAPAPSDAPRSYAGLLVVPSAEQASPSPPSNTLSPSHTIGAPQQVSAHDQASLRQFAADLRNHIVIPLPLVAVEPTGRAKAVVRRLSPNEWSTFRLHGDPYVRAILGEALSTVTQAAHQPYSLKHLKEEAFEVVLSYRVVQDFHLRLKPIVITVEGSTIHIEQRYQKQNKIVRMLAAQNIDEEAGGVEGGVNFIAVAAYIYELWEDRDPYQDASVVRLRTSSAFKRPIR